jgi:hypothetical protein
MKQNKLNCVIQALPLMYTDTNTDIDTNAD